MSLQGQSGTVAEGLGGREETLGGDCVDAFNCLAECAGIATVEHTAPHRDGYLFGVDRTDCQLTDKLSLCRFEFPLGDGCVGERVNDALRQAQTSLHVVGIAAEIDGQQAVVAHQ